MALRLDRHKPVTEIALKQQADRQKAMGLFASSKKRLYMHMRSCADCTLTIEGRT